MVTYLPTILMNLINQATSYLHGQGKYSLVITVNITCMMVLTSVYLSVSTSLPKTSNIKPVEVWLLFNLAYPILVILVNIVLQVKLNMLLLLLMTISSSENRNTSEEKERRKREIIDRLDTNKRTKILYLAL